MKTETEIEYLGVRLLVQGNYESEEQQVMYDVDLLGQPYSPPQFTIEKVLTESGDDILGIFLDFQREDIIELCLINLEN